MHDLVVVGTGAAASAAAHRCRQAGWSVAVVDQRPYGGTCALRGCDPKKVLVGAAAAVDGAGRMPGIIGDSRIDWPQLMAFKRTFTQGVPEDRQQAYAKAGITTLEGRARFTGPRTLDVAGQEVGAEHVLIATGARPRPLGIPGERHVATSEEFLDLDTLPERIVFIGGGYISFEFAHIAARAGAEVTILHRSQRPLKQFDPGLVDRLVEHSRSIGIDVRLEAPAHAIEGTGPFDVQTPQGSVGADLVVHGAGRVPDTDMDLDKAGVEHGARGIHVDDHLRTTNPRVYAAGDVANTGAPLTPVASMHGRVVATNLLGGDERIDDRATVSVVFTTPPLAMVGATQDDDAEVREGSMDAWYSTRRLGGGPAGYRILQKEGRIIGVHLLGPGADEHINLFALAIRQGIPAAALTEVLWAYPSHGHDTTYMV